MGIEYTKAKRGQKNEIKLNLTSHTKATVINNTTN